MRKLFFLCCFCSLLLLSCGEEPSVANKKVEKREIPAEEKVPVPKFNRDSAYAYLVSQVDMGPRIPNSDAHAQARDFFVSELKKVMDNVQIQEFPARLTDGKKIKGYNIIASYKPKLKHRILLGAHWDSRIHADHDPEVSERNTAVPGANDGASGVAILLEVSRILGEHALDYGIDIAFFDLEDQGEDGGNNAASWCLGAQYFARNLPRSASDYSYGILLDMVGADSAQFPKEAVSQKFAPAIQDKIWQLADAMGYGNYFVDKKAGGVTDDHLFINRIAGIPMIDIIDKRQSQNGFFPEWHTVEDDLEIIDKGTLSAVGQVVVAAVYKSHNGDL